MYRHLTRTIFGVRHLVLSLASELNVPSSNLGLVRTLQQALGTRSKMQLAFVIEAIRRASEQAMLQFYENDQGSQFIQWLLPDFTLKLYYNLALAPEL